MIVERRSPLRSARFPVRVAVLALLAGVGSSAEGQSWRRTAGALGSTTRILLIGARPEDEDNALMAWLSVGRGVETGYLSLTRGEAGENVAGSERESALAVVRTAELLAERQRDGAHQFFTRAYDFGSAKSDSIADAAWPHDSLLVDVVSIVRAFRPQVIVSLFPDSTGRDAVHRVAARLAREAFTLAADTLRFPTARTSRLPAWTVSRLFTLADGASAGRDGVVAIDVGEFDRSSGRSYAELGAEIRLRQRTQPPTLAPPIGHVWRFVRLEGTRSEDVTPTLLGSMDTTWARFRGAAPGEARAELDSLSLELADVHSLAGSAAPDSLAAALARLARRTTGVRRAFSCADVSGVPACAGLLSDLAVSLNALRERATRAMLDAAGIVIEGRVARDAVAAGDSVAVVVTVFNGGTSPLVIRRVAVAVPPLTSVLERDVAIQIAPDSAVHWSSMVRVLGTTYHWWQVNGLAAGTWLHRFDGRGPVPSVPQLIEGEDRIPNDAVEATISIAGVDVPVITGPLVYRDAGMVRGDARRPLAGVPPISVLLERTAEYERANLPVDALFRVLVSNTRAAAETLAVAVHPPKGLEVDSASRRLTLAPFASRSVFFRLRGRLAPGSDSISASVTVAGSRYGYTLGVITHDYPHIPSQRFHRASAERLEAVDLRVPARLRVAYIRGDDDLHVPLGQLQINVQMLEPSLLSAIDLSAFSTVLIGAGAMVNDALAAQIPALRAFARRGGTVVVLPGGDAVARSGLFPYAIAFDSVVRTVSDPDAELRASDPKSSLLGWPNLITARDFQGWAGAWARDVPAAYDPRYRTVLSIREPGHTAAQAGILVSATGRGAIVYTSLSLDRQLAAVNAGAARLLVNLLSMGLAN